MLLFIKYFSDTSDTCLRQQVNPRFYIEELRAEHGIYFLFDYWILYNIKTLNITTNQYNDETHTHKVKVKATQSMAKFGSSNV